MFFGVFLTDLNIPADRAEMIKQEPGATLSPYRFRANIYVDGVAAWSEFGWIGRKIKIGDVEVRQTDSYAPLCIG